AGLPGAGGHDHGRAWGRGRGADDRRWPLARQGARRQPDRAADAPARQGDAAAAPRRRADRRFRRHGDRAGGRDPGEPDRAPKGTAARVRWNRRRQPPADRQLLLEDQDLLGRLGRLTGSPVPAALPYGYLSQKEAAPRTSFWSKYPCNTAIRRED